MWGVPFPEHPTESFSVRPSATHYIEHHLVRSIVFSRKACECDVTTRKFIPNFGSLLFCKFPTFFKDAVSVLLIFRAGYIFKVVDTVICFITVPMVDFKVQFWRIAQESPNNQSMYKMTP